jgi:formyl-CoA transferase
MAGSHLAAGVLAALFQRTETGRGQHVEVALQDAIIPSLTSNIAGFYGSGGRTPERTGNRHGGLAVAPYNAYEASDGWVTILCPTDAHWERLSTLIGDPASEDSRIADLDGRCTHMDLVDGIVGRWTKTLTKSELESTLRAANIPFAAVVTLPELLDDPHVRERRVIRSVTDEQGTFTTLGSPLFLSDSPTRDPVRARTLGADTDDILLEELGMSADEVQDLRTAGVV